MSVFEYHNLLKNVTIKYEINPSKSLPLETEREKRGNVYKKFADNVFNKFSPIKALINFKLAGIFNFCTSFPGITNKHFIFICFPPII